MELTPRQVAVRGREAAALLVAAIEREGLVARFLRFYATQFSRPERAAEPARFRELVGTVGRESLLEMVAHVEEELPQRLRINPKARLESAQLKARRELLNLFRQEFYTALGQALGWEEAEMGEFWRDLELYRKLAARDQRQAWRGKLSAAAAGPFADRVALLLDPAMLDKARQVARKFQAELHAATDAVLGKVFSRRREN